MRAQMVAAQGRADSEASMKRVRLALCRGDLQSVCLPFMIAILTPKKAFAGLLSSRDKQKKSVDRAMWMLWMARCHLRAQQPSSALPFLLQSIVIAQSNKLQSLEAECKVVLAECTWQARSVDD